MLTDLKVKVGPQFIGTMWERLILFPICYKNFQRKMF